jgi:hypothetical protein
MIKRVGNISLSVILLISFAGFSINMHYCHEKLYDLAIVSEAHSCCEDLTHSHLPTCYADSKTQQSIHDCEKDDVEPMHCENRSVKLESPDNFIVSAFTFNLQSEPLVLFLSSTNPADLSSHYASNNSAHKFYSNISPPGKATTQAILQSYRN